MALLACRFKYWGNQEDYGLAFKSAYQNTRWLEVLSKGMNEQLPGGVRVWGFKNLSLPAINAFSAHFSEVYDRLESYGNQTDFNKL